VHKQKRAQPLQTVGILSIVVVPIFLRACSCNCDSKTFWTHECSDENYKQPASNSSLRNSLMKVGGWFIWGTFP